MGSWQGRVGLLNKSVASVTPKRKIRETEIFQELAIKTTLRICYTFCARSRSSILKFIKARLRDLIRILCQQNYSVCGLILYLCY